jgi:DAPG hydrolase PhiG domain
MNQKYIGYSQEDFVTPYSKFYQEQIDPIPLQVFKGLGQKKKEPDFVLTLENVTDLHLNEYHEVENGYTFLPDGSIQVSVLTDMPNVTPLMWDWWFGWHGSHDNRYKLWHPKAHQSAQWKDGREDLDEYIGRTSLIEEFIGNKLEKASIRFISPTELGFYENEVADKSKVVYICARTGYIQYPIDFGWLVHQIRATENGSEMRSRFWMGGEHIAFRTENKIGKFGSKILQKIVKLPEQQAIDLMRHCSEEMNHLAKFLPELYYQIATKTQRH